MIQSAMVTIFFTTNCKSKAFKHLIETKFIFYAWPEIMLSFLMRFANQWCLSVLCSLTISNLQHKMW